MVMVIDKQTDSGYSRVARVGGRSYAFGDAVGASQHDEVPQQRRVEDHRHALIVIYASSSISQFHRPTDQSCPAARLSLGCMLYDILGGIASPRVRTPWLAGSLGGRLSSAVLRVKKYARQGVAIFSTDTANFLLEDNEYLKF